MKPRVCIVADVRTWAWARKAAQLEKHLGDEFDMVTVFPFDRRPDPVPPQGFDLWHSFEVFQAPQLLELGVPYVTGITAHVWDGHERQRTRPALIRWMGAARGFHANSVLLAHETFRRYGVVSHYCPNGVDESFFVRLRDERPRDRLVVGWVGKPNARKGRHLVEAACSLAGAELRVVARTHRDALDAEAMRDFYQGIHVLCVASDMDGTPNPALEAAACGVAVVGNRIGNLPEFVEDGVNGLLVGPVPSPDPAQPSAAELGRALAQLVADVPLALRMGEAARATVERDWTWARQARNYARMWSAALAGAKEAA